METMGITKEHAQEMLRLLEEAQEWARCYAAESDWSTHKTDEDVAQFTNQCERMCFLLRQYIAQV